MKKYRGNPFITWKEIALLAVIGGIFIGSHAIVSEMDKPVEEEPVHTVVIHEAKAEVEVAVPEETVPEVEEVEVEEEPKFVSLGEFKITHYCPCSKCCGKWADGITSTGTTATEGRTIAVDPSVIPYGTEVVIRYENGTESVYIAEDCGGSIKKNRIDVFMNSHEAALVEGVKYGEVFVKEVAA